jgi:hypothetical protein
MSKLVRSEIGSNSDLVTAVKDDINDAFNLSHEVNNFIQGSKKQNGENGMILDGEIWNNIRDRFSQCLTANNNRRVCSAKLTNAIEEANNDLKSYVAEPPIHEDPDTDKIANYKRLSNIHWNYYLYFKTHKTKYIGNDKDGNPQYDYDQDAIEENFRKYYVYRLQYLWLEKLVPTDNSVTVKVYSVDLTGMKVEAF